MVADAPCAADQPLADGGPAAWRLSASRPTTRAFTLLRSGAMDSLGVRLISTIACAMLLGAAFAFAATHIFSTWAKPTFEQSGLPRTCIEIIRMLDAAPPASRQDVAAAASSGDLTVRWIPRGGISPSATSEGRPWRDGVRLQGLFARLGLANRTILVRGVPPASLRAAVGDGAQASAPAYYLLARLGDGSWVALKASRRDWGHRAATRAIWAASLLVASALGVAWIQARFLVRPLQALTGGIVGFGADLRAAPIAEQGPAELRGAIAAVNAMQVRIRGFVDERLLLFATLSHDLRTPLTRLRLRVERQTDPERGALLRNIDQMSAMLDQALAICGQTGDAAEPATLLDVATLIQLIVDDWADQGVPIVNRRTGDGAALALARPVALRRAVDNVVDNARRYARDIEITINAGRAAVVIAIEDRGPGVPADMLECVFEPYQRLSVARGRAAGAGLGLTSTRRILRSHGGDARVANRPGGGLTVTLSLPAHDVSIPLAPVRKTRTGPAIVTVHQTGRSNVTARPGPARR